MEKFKNVLTCTLEEGKEIIKLLPTLENDDFLEEYISEEEKKEIRDKNTKVKLKTAIEKFDENDENLRKGKRNKKVFETERIFEKNLDKNEYVYVYREINRMHDNYHENIKTENGEIIHESYEKLSDHIGHGKAKK